MAISLLELRTQARQRANMENSTFITDAEFNQLINYSISHLQDKIIAKAGEDYFASSQLYTLIDGTYEYSLPADFYKVISCQIKGDNQFFYQMKRFEYVEQNQGAYPLNTYVPDIRYRIRGDNLVITPPNSIGGRQINLIYVPIPPKLTGDSDELNGYNGWEEYVIVSAAIKALHKEESDTSDLAQEFALLEARIERLADTRDQAQEARIYDNSRYNGNWRWFNGV